MSRNRWCAGLMLAVVASLAGCSGTTIDPKLAAELRSKYLLTAEPADPSGVIEVKESVKEPKEVVLIGMIGGIDNPWTKGEASFVVADLENSAAIEEVPATKSDGKTDAKAAHDHHAGPGHDPATCPFCSKKFDPTKGLALVKIVDDAGKVLAFDAKELFQLNKDQLVVVQGRAEQDASGALVVSAKHLYVRK
ncbi:MAG: hypothetical protein JNM18_02135 [Planctomycetaceae bacterium]|nr:hypothetical protein [Planctomycetaceae bacterium]